MVDRDALSPDPGPDPGTPGLRTSVFVAGTFLLFAAPHAALAAASLGGSCDMIARELKSVEIPVETLTVDIVDHMSEDHGAADSVIGREQDPTAPLLFLTPRVAHILEDVFGDAQSDPEPSSQPGLTPTERVRQIMLATNAANKAQGLEATTTPSAGGGDGAADRGADFDATRPAISSGPVTEAFYDADALPRFQRRMYRNDI